jgi:hypothetical protein
MALAPSNTSPSAYRSFYTAINNESWETAFDRFTTEHNQGDVANIVGCKQRWVDIVIEIKSLTTSSLQMVTTVYTLSTILIEVHGVFLSRFQGGHYVKIPTFKEMAAWYDTAAKTERENLAQQGQQLCRHVQGVQFLSLDSQLVDVCRTFL